MRNDCIEEIEYRDCVIKIYPDEDAESPREWDNLGTMVCFHDQYDLGDKHDLHTADFSSWDEIQAHLEKEEKARIILPLYLYDHSGLRIKIGSFRGLLSQGHAEFDSGMIGFIYVSGEKLRKEYSVRRITKKVREKAITVLESEVSVYDDYLRGAVYGYEAKTRAGESIDSCWGFIGDMGHVISEANSSIDYYIRSERKKHCDKLKNQIRSHAALQYRTPLSI